MGGLSTYIYTLVVAGVLTAVLETLLPSGNSKRFASMAMGLVLLALAVRPLLVWLQAL